jgi:hypothetical protein
MKMERSQNIMIFQNTKSKTLCNIMTTFFRSVPRVSYTLNEEKSQKKVTFRVGKWSREIESQF